MDTASSKQIDLEEIFKKIRVDNISSFELYLKEIWIDLAQRTEDKYKGITKLNFISYYNLPGILSERLFIVFDQNRNGFLDLTEFIEGMKILFCGDFNKNSKFVFNFYDFDKDGKITFEDIRVVMSYINLSDDNPEIEGYKKRVHSQDELYQILNTCFKDLEEEYMTYGRFKKVIQSVNSDIYLMTLLFLFEKKPFTKACLLNYEKQQETPQIKPHAQTEPPRGASSLLRQSKSPTQLAAPSTNSTFSPYALFIRTGNKRMTTVTENKIGLKEKFLHTDDIRTNQKRYTLQEFKKQKNSKICSKEEEKGLTDKPLQPSSFTPKLTSDKTEKGVRKERNNEDLYLTPAFKQENYGKDVNKKKEDSETSSIHSNNVCIYDEEGTEFKLKFDSDNEEEDEEKDLEQDKEDSVVQHQGYLFKYVNKKMKKLWFKLFHKDLYYFHNEKQTIHKGMHNLCGLFLQEEPEFVIEEMTYYSFSIIYPNKKRVYYVNTKEEFNQWVEKLKIATGYTELSDLYEIKQKLGNGKFGLVKLGINKKTGIQVAIKIMEKKEMSPQDLELVRTEIEILRICQHPNIIKLHEVFENVNYFYILMEYCSGSDLFNYLQVRNFQLDERRACEIIHKMCTAVFYIHSYGIAHRDLKPENILMTSKEDDADIRILDFGLSKIIGPDEKCTEPYGTLSYVAPELLLEKPYSKAVDLWSIGVTTYFLLGGRLPFDSKINQEDIAKKIVNHDPSYSSLVWERISPEAIKFINALLEKDPNKRMNIKETLEHEWIMKYSGKSQLAETRQKSKDVKKSTFEIYSSVDNV